MVCRRHRHRCRLTATVAIIVATIATCDYYIFFFVAFALLVFFWSRTCAPNSHQYIYHTIVINFAESEGILIEKSFCESVCSHRPKKDITAFIFEFSSCTHCTSEWNILAVEWDQTLLLYVYRYYIIHKHFEYNVIKYSQFVTQPSHTAPFLARIR